MICDVITTGNLDQVHFEILFLISAKTDSLLYWLRFIVTAAVQRKVSSGCKNTIPPLRFWTSNNPMPDSVIAHMVTGFNQILYPPVFGTIITIYENWMRPLRMINFKDLLAL